MTDKELAKRLAELRNECIARECEYCEMNAIAKEFDVNTCAHVWVWKKMKEEEKARVRCCSDKTKVSMETEESYENMAIRERFEKLRRLMKQDYRDVFKARCMAMADLCKEMVSHLELNDDWCESWEALHALTECAKTFVETDIPLFEVRSREDLQAGTAINPKSEKGK